MRKIEKIRSKHPIFAISGPSASGKSSVWSPLKNRPEDFCFSVSTTTRPMRPGEKHGEDYNYVSDKIFDDLIKNDHFLEWEHVHQHRYGTKKSDFLSLIDSGKKIIVEIDVNGAEYLKKMFDKVVTIFIMPPSIEEGHKRLRERNAEDEEAMEIRKKRYDMEIAKSKMYDFVIINDDLKKAQEELQEIIDIF